MTALRFPITRRALLWGAAAAAASTRAHAGAPRIAIIDWALLETALALGIAPVAATELIQFRKIVVEPEVPESVVDLGLRGAPSYELLHILHPDLILISNFYEPSRPRFERIARVASFAVHQPGQSPYPLAVDNVARLGALTGRSEAARRYIAETDAELDRLRETLGASDIKSAYVVVMGDARHLQAFGHDSIFGHVMGRLGIANAWTHATRYGAAAPVGLETLAATPEAAIVIVSPLPPDFERTRTANALWQALPAVRQRRVAVIPPVNHFGGLPSARRFARLFVAAIREMESTRHG